MDNGVSWVIEAIEREAMNRAVRIAMRPESIRIFGLSHSQIMALIELFKITTGCDPTKMAPTEILDKGGK